jgi:hypothetical protein
MFIDIIHDEPVISETSKQTRKNEKTKSETTCRLSLITWVSVALKSNNQLGLLETKQDWACLLLKDQKLQSQLSKWRRNTKMKEIL